MSYLSVVEVKEIINDAINKYAIDKYKVVYVDRISNDHIYFLSNLTVPCDIEIRIDRDVTIMRIRDRNNSFSRDIILDDILTREIVTKEFKAFDMGRKLYNGNGADNLSS
jgi:hypothetical protein